MKWRYDTHFLEALYVVFVAFCLVLLSSCAHDPTMDKRIAEKTANLPALGPIARSEAAEKAVAAAPLSEDKRQKLEQLSLATSSELQALNEQNAKLRLLLVRELMDPTSDDREIDAIKKRILETEHQSNKKWLSALEEARDLLGRKSAQDQRFYKVFMYRPGLDLPNEHKVELKQRAAE